MINPFKKAKATIGVHEQVETGAYGGVIPRISPITILGNTFGTPFGSESPNLGISVRIAARPPSGNMLKSADYHSNIITGTGFVGLMKIAGTASSVIDRVVHTDKRNVHPSFSRKTREGVS